MVEKGVLGSSLIKKRRYWPQVGWGCGRSSRFNKREEI